jgi:NAD(P)-dependent dehydrogenase (short-subunit alcohol dehydrogenase family)
MDIQDQVALVTGANRGIGRTFVEELLARGARKVDATARRPEAIDIPGVEVVRLDLTDPASVTAAAEVAQDVTLVVNNAGISTGAGLLTGDMTEIRREMDTHYFGTLGVIRAFAPVLAANGGGGIVNILSALSWFAAPGSGGYAAAKAAEWNMTNALRLELAGQGTLVQGVHLGAADTDIMAGYDGPKIDPRDVVDDWSRMVKDSLSADPKAFYQQMQAILG